MGQINLFDQGKIEKEKNKKKSFSDESNLFGANSQTEEKFIRNDYKPKYFLSDTDDYLEALITNVKVTLLKAGLDKKAQEFINRVYKSNGNHYEIIKDYVILVNPTQILKTPKQAANARKKKIQTWKSVSKRGGLY